jgi:hypothetical protein
MPIYGWSRRAWLRSGILVFPKPGQLIMSMTVVEYLNSDSMGVPLS